MFTPKDPSEFNSPEEVTAGSADVLAHTAATYAHGLYWHKDFQKLAELDSLEQVEQDRIFNELIVSCLGLIMLSLEAPDLQVDDETRKSLHEVRDEIPAAHVRHLAGLGIEKKHLGEWETLIDMRYSEYARNRHEARAASMEVTSAEKTLDLKDMALIQAMAPLQSVAFGCHDHICRGETEGRDEFLRFILKMLSKFYIQFRLTMEDRKLSPLKRAEIAVRRAIRKFPGKKH